MTNRQAVPCRGCVACCKGQEVVLHPERDDPSAYFTVEASAEILAVIPGAHSLRRKANGDCIYLGIGCLIHDDAPWACREFDCRRWAREEPEAMTLLLLPDDRDGEIRRAAMERL